jgi:two-component system phosphate regulon sensor histidine kinase PhoR
MAILIGIWESILVLVICAFLTTLVLWWYWRRRLVALGQELDRQHLAEIRDMIREFKHQASQCIRPIRDNLYLIRSGMQEQAGADVTEWPQLLRESLRDIEYYEWRLTRLIENIAFVLRLEDPDQGLPFSEVKLDVIVSDVVSEFNYLAARKGLSLAWWAVPERFPRMTANDEGLRHVFINLIDNAIKYCQKGDEIDVALEANEGKNVIVAQVSDTGPGILEEDWELIFQKGYTVEGARGRPPKEGGQGLGLYIVKLVVEKHGGTVEVTSKLGKGTTFTITLPIQRI